MSTTTLIRIPEGGAKIEPGQPVPDNPIIPFIEGDGIGVDITPVMKDVVDAAVAVGPETTANAPAYRVKATKNMAATIQRDLSR